MPIAHVSSTTAVHFFTNHTRNKSTPRMRHGFAFASIRAIFCGVPTIRLNLEFPSTNNTFDIATDDGARGSLRERHVTVLSFELSKKKGNHFRSSYMRQHRCCWRKKKFPESPSCRSFLPWR